MFKLKITAYSVQLEGFYAQENLLSTSFEYSLGSKTIPAHYYEEITLHFMWESYIIYLFQICE